MPVFAVVREFAAPNQLPMVPRPSLGLGLVEAVETMQRQTAHDRKVVAPCRHAASEVLMGLGKFGPLVTLCPSHDEVVYEAAALGLMEGGSGTPLPRVHLYHLVILQDATEGVLIKRWSGVTLVYLRACTGSCS